MLAIALLITITLQDLYPYPAPHGRYVSRIYDQNPVCVQFCGSYLQVCYSRRWSDCQSAYPDDPQAGLCFAQEIPNCIAGYEECLLFCRFDECVDTDPLPCP